MNNSIRSAIKSLKRRDLIWRYGSNLTPTLKYGFQPRTVASTAERTIIDKLNSDGVVVCDMASLFGGSSEFCRLTEATLSLIKEKQFEIEAVKRNGDNGPLGQKTFNFEMLGSSPVFDVDCCFGLFALDHRLLNIANAYLQMTAKLRYYNAWYTAASSGSARESQLWHFDREDRFILKVFIYLNDVDEGSGPFTYAPGTHKKGRFRAIKPEYFLEGGVQRSTDDQMDAVYPKQDWQTCIGKKGTIIFADTRGYHKGGDARTNDRVMFTCMYTSPASESRELIRIPADFARDGLSKEQLIALGVA